MGSKVLTIPSLSMLVPLLVGLNTIEEYLPDLNWKPMRRLFAYLRVILANAFKSSVFTETIPEVPFR